MLYSKFLAHVRRLFILLVNRKELSHHVWSAWWQAAPTRCCQELASHTGHSGRGGEKAGLPRVQNPERECGE